jgi:hypothetical protein
MDLGLPRSGQPSGAKRRTPNKSKEIQTIPRKKAWISLDSFGRFGTFQWLTTNPSKKIFSLASGSRNPSFSAPAPAGCGDWEVIPEPSAIDKKRRASSRRVRMGPASQKGISDTYAAIQLYFIVISGGNASLSVTPAPIRQEFAGPHQIQAAAETGKEWAASP